MDGMDGGGGRRGEPPLTGAEIAAGVLAVAAACVAPAASIALGAAKLGGLPVGWDIVLAPALVPPLVVAAVLLVAFGGDLLAGQRDPDAETLWIDRP